MGIKEKIKIRVKVKPQSRIEGVEKQEDQTFLVRVNAPPIEGKANSRVVELLAEHFKVSKSKVTLLSGGKSKIKLFEIIF
jgi:uncharacterized protein (TIGR00251 family)